MKKLHSFTLGVATVATLVAPFIVAHAQMMTDSDLITAPPPSATQSDACIINPPLQVWYPYSKIIEGGVKVEGVLKMNRYLAGREALLRGVKVNGTNGLHMFTAWSSKECPEGTQLKLLNASCIPPKKTNGDFDFTGVFGLKTPVGQYGLCE